MESNTFVELYNFPPQYNHNSIITWLNAPWKGKDKQESLLWLFAGLGLLDKINDYGICKCNFNSKTINKHRTFNDVFYHDTGKVHNNT